MTATPRAAASPIAWEGRLGSALLRVEHRGGPAGGPALRIFAIDDAGAPRHQWLRFDCGERAPHYHLDPDGRNERVPMHPYRDPVDFAIAQLREGFRVWLEKAGWRSPPDPSPAALAEKLGEAEAHLRNPRPRLDDLDVELLHSRLSEKWRTYGDDVLPAWVAEMDFPLAEPVRLVLQRAVDRFDVGYPIDPRRTGLLETFRDRMAARFGWEVETRRTEILTDVVQGLYVALGAFCGPGDGALVQTPIYPPFLQAVREMDRRLIECRARPGEGRFEFDVDALPAATDARVMLLCNPHNPTGRVFERAELEAFAEIALARDMVVVSDEIHADLVYPGREHVPFAMLGPEVAARTVTLTSATKAFNIPGLRCAVAHFGSEGLQERFNGFVPRHVRGGIGLLGLYATRAAWRHAQPWLDDVVAYLDGNRKHLARFTAERLPGVRLFEPEATYLAWLDFGDLGLPTTPGRFVRERAKIALSDGHHFGPGFEGFARVNFATSRALLTRVLEGVAGALAGA